MTSPMPIISAHAKERARQRWGMEHSVDAAICALIDQVIREGTIRAREDSLVFSLRLPDGYIRNAYVVGQVVVTVTGGTFGSLGTKKRRAKEQRRKQREVYA